jgi:hypothetical protein
MDMEKDYDFGGASTQAQKLLWQLNPICYGFISPTDEDDENIDYVRVQDWVNEKGWERAIVKDPELARLLEVLEKAEQSTPIVTADE